VKITTNVERSRGKKKNRNNIFQFRLPRMNYLMGEIISGLKSDVAVAIESSQKCGNDAA
jgi:hypothetical protein